MTRRGALIAIAGALIAMPAIATTFLPIPFRDLYAAAQTVVVVEVLEGHLVAADGEPCGARYKGRVVEAIKSSASGATIEFGYMPHLKIGATYLILLGGLSEAPIPGLPDFQSRCQTALPESIITANWRGAMEISGDTSTPTKHASWTVRPANLVTYPLGTRTTMVNGEKQLWYLDLIKRASELR